METNEQDERTTHFFDSARQVIIHMLAQREGGWIDFSIDDGEAINEYAAIIAQYAYDVANLTIANVEANIDEILPGAIDWIPDMDQWPRKEKEH